MKTTSAQAVSIAPELAHTVHNLPATDTLAPACLNCGTPVPDHFCGHCGQDVHHTHRFTLRSLLLHDLPHSIWHVDKGLLYTLRAMLTRPGATIAEYMAGRRARHFRPISYLLLIGGVSALAMSMLNLQPLPPERAAEMPKVISLAMDRYMNTFTKLPTLVYMVLLPVYALLARWLLRATRYNYAEMLLSQAFIMGTLSVPSLLVMTPLMWLMRETKHVLVIPMLGMLPSVVYPVWVYLQMLSATPLSAARRWVRALSTALLHLLVMWVAGFALIIYFVISLMNQDPALKAEFKAKFGKKPLKTEQPAPARH
ncbi:hypothetical protein GCM10023185_17150 [Hymenobacter saemangeumensis]|uniref:DUF3667 domain-containing protein n=1 Tax=Hymenobacter saemangeumensis TaxID=1084522 RepID=A0ABP8IAJ8_9BACT